MEDQSQSADMSTPVHRPVSLTQQPGPPKPTGKPAFKAPELHMPRTAAARKWTMAILFVAVAAISGFGGGWLGSTRQNNVNTTNLSSQKNRYQPERTYQRDRQDCRRERGKRECEHHRFCPERTERVRVLGTILRTSRRYGYHSQQQYHPDQPPWCRTGPPASTSTAERWYRT